MRVSRKWGFFRQQQQIRSRLVQYSTCKTIPSMLTIKYCTPSFVFWLMLSLITGCSIVSSPTGYSPLATIDKSSLTQTVVDNLDVSYHQAQNGIAALLQVAGSKITAADFIKNQGCHS